MTGAFMGVLFLVRELAHIEHLRTRSYAQHKALQEFYEGIVPLADEFAEAYQGLHGKLIEIKLIDNEFEGDIKNILRQHLEWIEENRADVCPKRHSAIHNIIDEIVALFYTTLYKLEFLE